LPPTRSSACSHAPWHTHDEVLNECTRYAPPALFQDLTKAIPLYFNYTVVVVLWVEFVHAPLEVPPEVLNWIKVR
jgi:hypothetical protein